MVHKLAVNCLKVSQTPCCGFVDHRQCNKTHPEPTSSAFFKPLGWTFSSPQTTVTAPCLTGWRELWSTSWSKVLMCALISAYVKPTYSFNQFLFTNEMYYALGDLIQTLMRMLATILTTIVTKILATILRIVDAQHKWTPPWHADRNKHWVNTDRGL